MFESAPPMQILHRVESSRVESITPSSCHSFARSPPLVASINIPDLAQSWDQKMRRDSFFLFLLLLLFLFF